jgi:hypothetical protein
MSINLSALSQVHRNSAPQITGFQAINQLDFISFAGQWAEADMKLLL